ncbi:DUF7827 domain-containing protein [Natrialba magadii]
MVMSVVAMSAAFTGAVAATNHDDLDEQGADDYLDSASTFWEGQHLLVHYDDDDYADDDEFELRDVDDNSAGSLVDQFSLDDGAYVIDTEGLDGNYVIEDDDGNIANINDGELTDSESSDVDNNDFEIAQQDFDAEFESDEVADSNSDFEVEFDSIRNQYDVNVSSDDLDEDDLDELLDEIGLSNEVDDENEVATLKDVSDGAYSLNFTDIDAGEYEFNFDVTDTAAESSATVNVTESAAADLSFAESDFTEERSNIAAIDIELQETSDAHVQIGEEDEVNYEVQLQVEDGSDDGNVTLLVDTTEMHTADDSAFWAAHEEDDVSVEDYEATSDVLEGGDYTLSLANDASFDDEHDTAFFTLNDRTELADDAVSIYTAPDDVEDFSDYNDTTVTSTDYIAQNDTLLATVDTTSLFAYFDDADEFSDVDDTLELAIVEQDPGPNADPVVFNATDNDFDVDVVDANQSAGQLIFAVDYSEAYDGSDEFELETDYDLEFTVSDENAFAEDNESAASEFVVEERELEWDDTAEEVPNSDSAIVTGETNVAPGTEVTTRARSTGNFTTTSDTVVEIDDDGDRYFEAEYDLSDYAAGTEFTLTANEDEESAEIDSVLVDADEAIITVDADAPSDAEVGEDVTLDVTISNTGGTSDEVDIGVVIAGENVDEVTTELESEGTWSNSYEFTADSEGDVEWSVTAGDYDEESGVTTFSDDDKSDDDKSDDDKSDDDGADDDGAADDGADDDGETDDGETDDDGSPGFGVAVALAALLGAAMLALRKQN